MLAIGKATSVDICRFFSKPGPYVSCDTMEFVIDKVQEETKSFAAVWEQNFLR
ncbi:hypothetical protein glysoja_000013 [Glycine soja]|nr:hypothetical protein glysoja_000013 [Glycine soja]